MLGDHGVAEMIGSELDLVAINAKGGWFCDYASVIDEDMETVMLEASCDGFLN